MKKGTREIIKLDKLVATCELLNDRGYGTPEKFRDAVYKLGHTVSRPSKSAEAFVKELQGKLYEIKYDGNLSKVGKDK